MCLKIRVSERGPQLTAWTNQNAWNCHAFLSPVLARVSAGARAPVIFSGSCNFQTCKIRRFKAKERPSPPISTLLNSMVALVLAESACTGRFEDDSSKTLTMANPYFQVQASKRWPRSTIWSFMNTIKALDSIETHGY